MQLNDDDLREFVQIWREEFKEEISIEEARARATNLLELYTLLSKRIPEALAERGSKKVQTIPFLPPRTMSDILKPKRPVE